MQDIFTDMKQTLGDSVPAYFTVTKWHAKFQWRRSSNDMSRFGWSSDKQIYVFDIIAFIL